VSQKKQLAVNIASQIAAFMVDMAINFFLTTFLVNRLGESVYGFVGLAKNFTTYIAIFTVSFNSTLYRFVTIETNKNNYEAGNVYYTSVTLSNLGVSLILLAPSALFALNIERFIHISPEHVADVRLLWLAILVSFLIALAGSSFAVSTFATNRLDLNSKRQLESYVIRAAILLALFTFYKPNVWYVGVSTIISTLFVLIINYYYKRKLTPYLRANIKYFSWSAVGELIGLGIWNSFNRLSKILLDGLDLLIANLLISPEAMGLLAIAKVIPVQLQSFYTAVYNVFSPRILACYALDDRAGLLKEVRFVMRTCGYLGGVPIMGFAVFSEPFFNLWMNGLSAESLHTVNILSLLTLLPIMFHVYVAPLYTVNMVTKKLKAPVLVSSGLGVVNTLLVLFLVKNTELGVYAVAGVSAALVILQVFTFSPAYAARSLNEKLSTFYPALLRGVINNGFLFILFSIYRAAFSVHSWLALGAGALACGAAGYISGLFILFDGGERKSLADMVVKRLKTN